MQSNFRVNKLQLVVLLALLFTAAFAMAQGITAGSISGTVVDPSSAVVAGATVTAQNIATGQTLNAETNDTGYFTFRSVPPGAYKITIAGKGFRPVEVPQVQVETSKDAALAAIKLELTSAAGETVEVVESAPILETTTGQVTNTFDTKETADLPTGGGFDSLALFLPGVADTGSNTFSNSNGVGFSSNGLRGRSNNFQIDGQSNNDNSVGGPSIFLGNQDLLGEVSVITNDFGVEYGRASGTEVNYVTKSGTNVFHGSAFEYFTGSFADSHTNEEKSGVFGFCAPGQDPVATGCTPVNPISRYVENRFGFTVGGPVYRNKVWFFGSGYWDRVRQAGSPSVSSNLTPTPTGLTELAAAFPGNLGVAALNAIGPYSVKAGNPSISGTPKTLTVTDGVTNAGIEFAGITRNVPSLFNDREFSGKVDFQVTNKDRLSTRYIFQQNILTGASGRFAAGAWVDIPARDQQIAIDWVHTFGTQIVNQARYSFSRAGFGFEGGSFPACTRANVFACPTNINWAASLLPFGIQNNFPQGRTINNTQIQDNASWARGRHTFKFGGEFYKQRSPNAFLPNANGTYNFSTSTKGGGPGNESCALQFPGLPAPGGSTCGFSRLLADAASSLGLTDGPPKFNFKEYDFAFYFGDDWRLKDNLTLNLGVRWEYSSQAINLLHDLSVANQAGSNPFWDPTLPASITTVPSVPNHFKYFEPNIGFAWKPRFLGSGDKTVVRGGFRLTRDPAFYNIFLNVATSAPTVNAGTIPNATCTAGGTKPCLVTSGFLGSDVRSAHFGDIPRGGNPGFRNYTQVAPDFHEPYVENWSLGIQRELTSRAVLEIRYVGNHEVGNFQTVNANPELAGLVANGFSSFIPAGVTPCTTAGTPGNASGAFGEPTNRANCNFTNIRNRENTSFSRYNGLQSEFRVAEWHGLSGAASFTWSKTLDNTSEIFGTNSGGNSVAGAQDPYNIGTGEKSLSGLDFPKIASLYLIYDLPFYKNQHGFLGKVLGGYQANTTYRYSTGQNYSPLTVPGFSSSCQLSFDATFYGPSTCRPFLGNPAAPIDTVGGCTNAAAADCGLADWTQLSVNGIVVPVSKSAVHWIYNEDIAAAFFKTPYGNTRRNPGSTRGQDISAVNFSMFKTTKLNERVSFRLEAQVYNLFNHQFRGVPDPFIDDCPFVDRNVTGCSGSFGNNLFNPSGGDYTNVILNGIGRRRLILGGKITF